MGRGLLSDCFSAKKACAIRYMISRAADIFVFSTYIRAFFLFFLRKYSRGRLFFASFFAWSERIYELFFVGNIFVSRAGFREPFLYIPVELFCFGSDYLSFYRLHSEYYNNRRNDCCRYAELRHCGKAVFMQSERSDF